MMRRIFKLALPALAILALIESEGRAQWFLYRMGSVTTTGRPHGVIVQGNYAYLGDWDAGLAIIDISNISNPHLLSEYNTAGLANSVQISGRYAYVADWNRGMAIIDINNPSLPQQVSFWDSPGQAVDIYISGNYAYIADYNAGIAIVDISNPASPQPVGRVAIGSFATGICGQGNHIYVSNSVNGLKSFDISTPDTAVLMDTYNSDGDACAVTGSGDYVYLSDGLQGVKIFSIADSSGHLSYVSMVETPGYVNDASIADTILYITDDVAGAIAVSVVDPAHPSILAIYDSPGTPAGICGVRNHAYLGDTNSFITLLLTDVDAVYDDDSALPSMFDIKRIYPNPFNPQTTVEFSLERRLPVSIDAYDLSGRLMKHLVTGLYEPGEHRFVWNASDLASGTYLVRLSSGGYSKSIKVTLLK
jgi:hypothetical protein